MTPQARLIIVAGLPGSGKTTLARQLEERCGAVRLCPDEWMAALGVNLHAAEVRTAVEKLQWALAQRLLTVGGVVIVEWGTWGQWERDVLRERARELGAAVELHYLTAPPEELFRRIQQRGMETPPITWEEIRRWEEVFEVPALEEFQLFDPPLP